LSYTRVERAHATGPGHA